MTVGETAVPAGYRATIHCGGQGPPQVYNGGPYAVTSPAEDGADRHLHDHQHPASLDRAGGQAVGGPALARRRSSSTGTARGRSTPRPSRPRAARAPPARIRPRRRSQLARSPCRTDTAPRFSAARVPRSPIRRADPGHGAGPSGRDPHLHDHEQAEALDGARRETVGRRAFVDHDLRRPGRRGSVPGVRARDRRRARSVFHLPGRDPDYGR